MHPYWGTTAPEVLSEYINSYTGEGDIVLDPFGGSAATAIEALRLNRRIAILDSNPLTAFIAEVVLKPASLPRLQWAFQDVQATFRDETARFFTTACAACGKNGAIEYVLRENGKPVQIAYRCACSRARLYKTPDPADKRAERKNAAFTVPFWFPVDIPLPSNGNASHTLVRELFTGRTLAGLSMLLHAIGKVEDSPARGALKLAFASLLEPGSRLKLRAPAAAGPGRKKTAAYKPTPTLYLPRKWREVNPWIAFENAFRLIYEGKKETNIVLKNAALGRSFRELESGQANVLILNRSIGDAPVGEIPDDSIDYAIAGTPSNPIPEGSLASALWKAWLGFESPADRHFSPAPAHQDAFPQGEESGHGVFTALRRSVKDGGYVHIFCDDRGGVKFHATLNLLAESGLMPERIVHQPVAGTTGRRARSRKSPAGAYVVRCAVSKAEPARRKAVPEAVLRRKLAATMKARLTLHGGAALEDLLHFVYGQLDADEISAFAKHPAEERLVKAAGAFADYRNGKFLPRRNAALLARRQRALAGLRQTVLDTESIAVGDPQTAHEAWQTAFVRMASAGFALEDLDAVRTGFHPEQIDQHRRKRFSMLLRDFGRVLGYRTSAAGKGKPAVAWRKARAGEIRFEFRRKEVRVQSRRGKNVSIDWGVISYFDLERGIREWCQNHPQPGSKLSKRLTPSAESAGAQREPNGRWGIASPIADLRLKVVRNRKVCAGHYLMELDLPRGIRLDFLPGQFFHMICDPDEGKERAYPLTLRRPFSIHGAQYAAFPRSALAGVESPPLDIRKALARRPARIDFLYRVVGEGTQALSRIRKGALLDSIGPLGNGFAIGNERTAVLVAGGIGVAPLIALAERLRYLGKEVLIYLGAVRKEMLGLAVGRPLSADGFDETIENQDLLDVIRAEFLQIGAQVLTVCTDDGSAGEKGLVTEMLEQGIRGGCVPLKDVCLYACGPEGMLKAVAEIAARHSLDCQVSLEERMACGIGACFSCTCRVTSPNGVIRKKRVCREGPVFKARDIQWKD
jgi:dihydroorotate dehydrogenase electron transfer subunit